MGSLKIIYISSFFSSSISINDTHLAMSYVWLSVSPSVKVKISCLNEYI